MVPRKLGAGKRRGSNESVTDGVCPAMSREMWTDTAPPGRRARVRMLELIIGLARAAVVRLDSCPALGQRAADREADDNCVVGGPDSTLEAALYREN